jgi:hypothetical protein
MLDANVETLSNIIKKRIFLDLHTDKYAGASVEELAIVGELFKLWNQFNHDLEELITTLDPNSINHISNKALDLDAAVSKAALGGATAAAAKAAAEAAKLPQRATLILSQDPNTAKEDPTPYSSLDID